MSTDTNNACIKYADSILGKFVKLLPQLEVIGSKKAVKRQAIELLGTAKMTAINGDLAGAALLVAVAEILKLARKTNSVQPLASLQMAIQFLDDYRDANEGVSIPF